MTPYETVRGRFNFPFELYPLQIQELNALTQFEREGFYWWPGCGKTAGSTHAALYLSMTQGISQWVLVMPPILLLQWESWLVQVKDSVTGKPLTVTVYEGSPKERQEKDLEADFILMSYGILKNDFERLYAELAEKTVGIICDEATAIKNHESDNHKAVKLLSTSRPLMNLTGTPINKPLDCYAYIRLMSPKLYRNFNHFCQLHVTERDEYDNVIGYANLELLGQNMRLQTSTMLLKDLRKGLGEPLITQVAYRLAPAHAKLYKRIAEERLVELESGGEINAISAQALRSALQQVVVNWGEFDEHPDASKRVPAVMEIIEEVLGEIGDRKLAIAAHFQRTNAYLLKALKGYGAVAIYGAISSSQKKESLNRFINDPTCRVIMLQPSSAGFGIDGLQHVCSDMVIVEAPTTPGPFRQVIQRLDRTGQTQPVHVRIAVAAGTVQVAMFEGLLSKDELINKVQIGPEDLRKLVFG